MVIETIKKKAKTVSAVVVIYSEAALANKESNAVETLVKQFGVNRVCIFVSDLSKMPSKICMCCCGAIPQCASSMLKDLGLS
ncbi:UNVERIFIED_CONTAM: hypothetical protein HDU68_011561 [Siphonaria sp. JEL0065]|nr:hypothetical protein HDU68_011561 [Siphonaria sp. JEL0065]